MSRAMIWRAPGAGQSGRLQSLYASHASVGSIMAFNIEEIAASNAAVALENFVVERYLARMEPELLIDLPQAIERLAAQEHRANFYLRAAGSATTTLTEAVSVCSASTLVPATMAQTMTWMRLELKSEMSARETDDLRKEIARARATHARRVAELRAHLQELTESSAELTAALAEFATTAEGARAGTRWAEASMASAGGGAGGGGGAYRWRAKIEDWLRRAQIVRDKLRLRTSQLRKNEKALHAQVLAKTELRQFVRAAHVRQMQCEHGDLLKDLLVRGVHCKEVKKITGTAKLELTTFKDELVRVERALVTTQQAVANCEAKIARTKQYQPPVAKEVLESFAKLQQLVEYRHTFSAPPAVEYVRARADLDLLRRQVSSMTRKRDVQRGALAVGERRLCRSGLRSLAKAAAAAAAAATAAAAAKKGDEPRTAG